MDLGRLAQSFGPSKHRRAGDFQCPAPVDDGFVQRLAIEPVLSAATMSSDVPSRRRSLAGGPHQNTCHTELGRTTMESFQQSKMVRIYLPQQFGAIGVIGRTGDV